MKSIKNIFYILFILSFGLLWGCEDETTEGMYEVTFFPTFEIQGSSIMTVVKGESFNDPGVITKEGYPVEISSIRGSAYVDPSKTEPSDVVYTNTVDTNTPGMYVITYSSTNPEGFSNTAERILFVLDKPSDPTVDLSGNYTSGTSPAAKVTKVADGVFYSTNAWGGGSGVIIPAYLISTDGINVNVPQQETATRIFGYGTIQPNGALDLRMSRPTFPVSAGGPLLNLVKLWEKE